MLTITEAAALLTQRGLTDRAGGPVKPDSVKHMRSSGKFPNAQLATSGHGAGRYWLIPVEDIEAYAAQRTSRRTPGPGKRLGRPRKDTRMTPEEAIQSVTEQVTRQVGAANITNLIVTHHKTAFGQHQIDVSYDAFGKTQSYRAFKSISGFSSSISGLDGRSLGGH